MSEDLFGGLVGATGAATTGGSLTDASDRAPGLPLAVRMRPRTLDEVVGQQHLLGPGVAAAPAGRGRTSRCRSVLWGPPGTGKTTLAHVVSRQTEPAVRRAVGASPPASRRSARSSTRPGASSR